MNSSTHTLNIISMQLVHLFIKSRATLLSETEITYTTT